MLSGAETQLPAIDRQGHELRIALGWKARIVAHPAGDYPPRVQAEQILVFRLARSGLAGRDAGDLVEAAACPASDFSRDAALLPWCKGCKSHHVPPMLWRYGGVKAGARLDSERRYVLGGLGRAPAATEAVRRFLHFYGPAASGDFAEWAGLARPHAQRLWANVESALDEVSVGKRRAWTLSDDLSMLASPPPAAGVRLIPPGDPYLQKPNRSLLAPETELRKRLFRPVASPGAVLKDGRLAGLWRVKARGRKAQITVQRLGRVVCSELEEEAQRICDLRGASEAILVLD